MCVLLVRAVEIENQLSVRLDISATGLCDEAGHTLHSSGSGTGRRLGEIGRRMDGAGLGGAGDRGSAAGEDLVLLIAYDAASAAAGL